MKEDPQASLPLGEDEVNALFDADLLDDDSLTEVPQEPLKSIVMPSLDKTAMPAKRPQIVYHDLDEMYPDAPVSADRGIVVHRADLIDASGVSQLMDWAADGDVTVVDLKGIIDSPTVLAGIVEKLTEFIVDDLDGELLQLTETRLLVLPPECRGMRGLADESLA